MQIDLFNFHSKGSVICKLTLIFAAAPSNKNADLLADLQKEVSSGKVGYFTVDKSRPVNVEPDEGKINIESRGKKDTEKMEEGVKETIQICHTERG